MPRVALRKLSQNSAIPYSRYTTILNTRDKSVGTEGDDSIFLNPQSSLRRRLKPPLALALHAAGRVHGLRAQLFHCPGGSAARAATTPVSRGSRRPARRTKERRMGCLISRPGLHEAQELLRPVAVENCRKQRKRSHRDGIRTIGAKLILAKCC